MTLRPQQRPRPLWLCAGWAALLLYAGTASPLGAELTALLAECDPGHRVALLMNADGVRVVLQHEGGTAAHHHGFVARALTRFTPPLHPGAPDHVLQFHSSAPATKPASLPLLVKADFGSSVAANLETEPWIAPEIRSAVAATAAPPAAPPLFCRRSTALLL